VRAGTRAIQTFSWIDGGFFGCATGRPLIPGKSDATTDSLRRHKYRCSLEKVTCAAIRTPMGVGAVSLKRDPRLFASLQQSRCPSSPPQCLVVQSLDPLDWGSPQALGILNRASPRNRGCGTAKCRRRSQLYTAMFGFRLLVWLHRHVSGSLKSSFWQTHEGAERSSLEFGWPGLGPRRVP
jgi:hypothetical protein